MRYKYQEKTSIGDTIQMILMVLLFSSCSPSASGTSGSTSRPSWPSGIWRSNNRSLSHDASSFRERCVIHHSDSHNLVHILHKDEEPMTYQRALEIINQADEVHIWGYALDDTGWYLFILDRNDEDFPEPLAWDIMLDEYRDAPDARKRAKRKETWWVSTVNPKETIGQNHWDTPKENNHDN